jgi:hypothetical protein
LREGTLATLAFFAPPSSASRVRFSPLLLPDVLLDDAEDVALPPLLDDAEDDALPPLLDDAEDDPLPAADAAAAELAATEASAIAAPEPNLLA